MDETRNLNCVLGEMQVAPSVSVFEGKIGGCFFLFPRLEGYGSEKRKSTYEDLNFF